MKEQVIIQTRRGMVVRQLWVEFFHDMIVGYYDGDWMVSPAKFERIIDEARRNGLVVVDNRTPWKYN